MASYILVSKRKLNRSVAFLFLSGICVFEASKMWLVGVKSQMSKLSTNELKSLLITIVWVEVVTTLYMCWDRARFL